MTESPLLEYDGSTRFPLLTIKVGDAVNRPDDTSMGSVGVVQREGRANRIYTLNVVPVWAS